MPPTLGVKRAALDHGTHKSSPAPYLETGTIHYWKNPLQMQARNCQFYLQCIRLFGSLFLIRRLEERFVFSSCFKQCTMFLLPSGTEHADALDKAVRDRNAALWHSSCQSTGVPATTNLDSVLLSASESAVIKLHPYIPYVIHSTLLWVLPSRIQKYPCVF